MLNGNKRVFCLLSAFLLLAGMAGCGSSEPSETTESVIHVGVSDRAFYGKFFAILHRIRRGSDCHRTDPASAADQ